MYGNAGFCLLVGNDILEDLASHMSDGTVLAQKTYPGDGKHTLLLYECLLFRFMSSNCQKSRICKGSTSKHEVHKDVQTEFETSNFFKGILWLLICCFSLVTAT